MKEKLSLLVLGALLGAIPTIINSWLQAKWTSDQRTIERKLDVLRAFSAACYRGLAVSQRTLNLSDVALALSISLGSSNTPKTESDREIGNYVETELGAVQKELDQAFASYRSEMAIANALFGTSMAPGERPPLRVAIPITPLTQQDKKELERQLNDFRKAVESLQRKCEDNTTQLTSSATK
jgi:hypothetical protein